MQEETDKKEDTFYFFMQFLCRSLTNVTFRSAVEALVRWLANEPTVKISGRYN